MKKTIVLLLLAATTLAGCNTVSGAGKDISGAGQGITNTSDNVHQRIDNR